MEEKKKVTKKEGKKETRIKSRSVQEKKIIEKSRVPEIFEVKKDGKEEIIETHPVEVKQEEKPVSGEQLKKEKKIFRSIIIVMIGFVLMFCVVYMITNSMRHFSVQGVPFEIVKEGQLTLYRTSIPVTYNGSLANFNFYLRTDPRTLDSKVPLIGNLTFRQNMVLKVTTQDLFCSGDWNIGLANLQQMYEIYGINMMAKNESTLYLPANEYMFITINKGNQTEIVQTSSNSYDIDISNCEVLPAFERLMLETFARDRQLNSQ